MLDTVHRVETPEGVRLTLQAAGPVPRGLAFAFDVTIRFMAYVLSAAVLPLGSDFGIAWIALLVFGTEWLYPVAFEVLGRGQTPGKRLVGIRVVNDDGTPVGWSTSLLRNLLLSADVLPGTYAAGLVSMLASPGFRRLGDHAAGTLVIHVASHARREAAPAREGVAALRPLAPPVPLGVEEQRAVIAFGEREALLSEARAAELAALAVPLCAAGEPDRVRLRRIAAWLLGRRGEAP